MKGIIAGIDPSLTNTAVCISNGRLFHTLAFPSKPLGKTPMARISRYHKILEKVIPHVENAQPVAIYLEGYSYASKNKNHDLGEWGGLLRERLCRLATVIEVPPATLKRFTCGTGNAKKEQMLAHIQKRWNVMFETNDEGDAFALCKLGCMCEGLAPPETKVQAEVVAKLNERKAIE